MKYHTHKLPALNVDISELALAGGYHVSERIHSIEELDHALYEYHNVVGPILLLIECSQESSSGIPRVTHTPIEIRDMFREAFNQID